MRKKLREICVTQKLRKDRWDRYEGLLAIPDFSKGRSEFVRLGGKVRDCRLIAEGVFSNIVSGEVRLCSGDSSYYLMLYLYDKGRLVETEYAESLYSDCLGITYNGTVYRFRFEPMEAAA